MEITEERKICNGLACDLETMIVYRAESGLFIGADRATGKEVELLHSVAEARALCLDDKIVEAQEKLGNAYVTLQNLVAERGTRWRFYNVSAGPVYVYYWALTLAFLLFSVFYEPYITSSQIGVIPLEAAIYGALGGLLRGFWWLHKKVEGKAFRHQFTLPFMAGPWLGMLLGMFAWALLMAGLLLAGDPKTGNGGLAPGTVALIILSGFSWEWVMLRLDPVIKGEKGA